MHVHTASDSIRRSPALGEKTLAPRHHVIETDEQVYIIYRQRDLADVPDAVLGAVHNALVADGYLGRKAKRVGKVTAANRGIVATRTFQAIVAFHQVSRKDITETVLAPYDPAPQPMKAAAKPAGRKKGGTKRKAPVVRKAPSRAKMATGGPRKAAKGGAVPEALMTRAYLGEPRRRINEPVKGTPRAMALKLLTSARGATEAEVGEACGWGSNPSRGLFLLHQKDGYGIRIDERTGKLHAYTR